MPAKDHDLLIELTSDVKYIKDFIEANTKSISENSKRISNLESWKDNMDGRLKVFVGIAAFVGGLFMFAVDKAYEFITGKGA